MHSKGSLHLRTGSVVKLGMAGVVLIAAWSMFGCVTAPPAVTWVDVPGVHRPEPKAYPEQNDNAIGDPHAPVRMDEYGDFQCIYCRQFALNTEPQIINSYVATGKVYFVFHSMGNFLSHFSTTVDTESEDAAMAAYAAGDQHRFWQYHDVLFANQKRENSGWVSRSALDAFARAIGIDLKRFNAELSSGTYRARVMRDETDGTRLGVKGTPTFFVNGRKIVGAQSFALFRAAIDSALAAKRSN